MLECFCICYPGLYTNTKITRLFHIQIEKIYNYDVKSYTAVEKETVFVIVSRVNLCGDKNRPQDEWGHLTKYSIFKSLYFFSLNSSVITLIATIPEEAI